VSDTSIVLVEMDAGVAVGDPIALHVEYNPMEGVVAARPVRGIVLERERTYAAALLAGVMTADGEPLSPSPALVAVRDGDATAVPRALALIGPAIDAIVGTGVARADVIAATAFTTWDYTGVVREITSAVDAHFATTPPTVAFERVITGAELDTVLGVPAAQRPGLDNASADGEEGEWAIAHDGLAMIVQGSVTGPRVIEGSTTDLGFPRNDASGALVAGPEQESIPWLLWVPEGADLTNVPVVLGVGGIGGRKDLIGDLPSYMGAGYAVLTYDPYGNGRRAASATDVRHALRGPGAPMTPDGLEEHTGASVISRAFGIEGAAPGLGGCPLYTYGVVTQLIADVKAMLRFVRSGDLSPIRSAVPELAGLAFDQDRLGVIAFSLGSYIATSALVDEPGLSAATLVVAYGSGADLGCESPVYRPRFDTLFGTSLGVRNLSSYDEVTHRLAMHPVVDVYRWLIDGLEPQVNARHLVSDPLHSGELPDLLWQLGDVDETTGTPSPDALCGAAGVPGFGEYPFAEVTAASLPLSGNLDDGRTAACYRFTGAGHGLAGYQRGARTHDPPIVVGQRELATAIEYDNPTEQAVAQELHFLGTAFTGTGEIITPP